ncbi:hypothetical protein NMG60_11004230 [Bertholletia excelsa]
MEDDDEEPVSEISRELDPIPAPRAPIYSLQPLHRSLLDSGTQFSSCSLASFWDPLFHEENDSSVVFPPSNHEGLHVSSTPSLSGSNHDDHQQEDDHTFLYSQSEENELCPPAPLDGGCEVARFVGFCFEFLRSRVNCFLSSLRHYFSLGRAHRSFSSAAGVAMVLLLWWFYVAVRRRIQRSRVHRESRDQLILRIKEKDEKINQLLHQIAQMNQLLLALHRDSSSGTRRPT